MLIGADDPEAMLRHTQECRSSGIPFIADPSQQLAFADGPFIRKLIDGADYLFTNEYESHLTETKTGWSQAEIDDRVTTRVITRGKDGADIRTKGQDPIHVPIAGDVERVDPTGVGDAFRAGFLVGLAGGLGHERCAQIGSVLAAHVLRDRRHPGVRRHPQRLPRPRSREAYGDDAAAGDRAARAVRPRLTDAARHRDGPPAGRAAAAPPGCSTPPAPTPVTTSSRPAPTSSRAPCSRPTGSGCSPWAWARTAAGAMGWWSPDPRGVIPAGGLRVSRSLRKALRPLRRAGRHRLRRGRRALRRPRRARAGGSPPRSPRAYGRLHALGWAHSVETWQDDELVGGLYGVSIGGLFAGESMFHAARDASKVALVGLVERFHADGDPRRLVDVQWATDHLRRLGAQEWPRERYLDRLAEALRAASGRAVGLTAVGARRAEHARGTRSSRSSSCSDTVCPFIRAQAGTSDQAASSSARSTTVVPGASPRAARASRMTGTGHREPRASTTGGPPRRPRPSLPGGGSEPLTGRPSRAGAARSRRHPAARGRAGRRRRRGSATPPRAAG